MNLVLEREILTDQSTIGRLSIEGKMFCSTLEDPVRENKVYGHTAIHIGRYRVVITMSQRFKKPLPLLLDVPEFSGVRIHAGNTSEDTEGCILVGLTKDKDFIGKSKMAMSLLLPKIEEGLKSGEVWIEVRNP